MCFILKDFFPFFFVWNCLLVFGSSCVRPLALLKQHASFCIINGGAFEFGMLQNFPFFSLTTCI